MPINNFNHYKMTWQPKIQKNTIPIYKQLTEQLIHDIKSSILTPGDQLPPQRELADFLDVNLTTITRVYKHGEELGILTARVGKGTFVSFGVNVEEQMLYDDQYQNIIHMGTIFPPYNGINLFRTIIKKITDLPNFVQLLEYQSPNGAPHQRKVIIKYLHRFSFFGNSNQLIITTGAQNALAGILTSLFQAGDRIAVTELTFPGLKGIAKMQGIKLIPIPKQIVQNCFPVKTFKNFLITEHIKGLYLVPEQNNPTTETLSNHARQQIASAITATDTLLIEDSINRVFCKQKVKPIASLAPEQTLYVFSTSKFMAAGLRVAYVFSPQKYMNKLDKTLYNLNLMVSPFNLEIVTQILESDLLERVIDAKYQELYERNQIVSQILGINNPIGETTCCFRWLILPNNWTSKSFEKAMLEHGVKIFSSEKFTIGHNEPPNAVRICISSPRSQEELTKGLKIMKELLKSNTIPS